MKMGTWKPNHNGRFMAGTWLIKSDEPLNAGEVVRVYRKDSWHGEDKRITRWVATGVVNGRLEYLYEWEDLVGATSTMKADILNALDYVMKNNLANLTIKEPAVTTFDFIVWNPSSDKPVTTTYPTYEAALVAAESMAQKYPGQQFVVAKLLTKVQMTKPELLVTNY